jgi:hypothetical protein
VIARDRTERKIGNLISRKRRHFSFEQKAINNNRERKRIGKKEK